MSDASRRDFLKYNVIGGVALATGLGTGSAQAAEGPLKVGFLMSYTGPSAVDGQEAEAAIKIFMEEHGDTVGGRKIEFLMRDSTGPSPEVNRRLAQDLILRDKVELLAGVDFTPNALAVAGISTEAKVPFLLVNAATSGILAKAPYMVRFGFTQSQICSPLAKWLPGEGTKKLYLMFSDYGPGLEAGAVFRRDFTAAGGEILGEVRIPLSNPDFSGYVQRIKDAKPQAIFAFLPAGEQSIAFLKAIQNAGIIQSGVRVYTTGDVTNETSIDAIGDPILGVVTSYFYSDSHDSPLNKSFVKRFSEVTGGKLRPNFAACITYDVAGAIYALAKDQAGARIDPDKAIAFLKTYKAESPRGPLEIDPDTRDAVGNIYLRKAERQGDKIVNAEFKTFAMVHSPATAVQ